MLPQLNWQLAIGSFVDLISDLEYVWSYLLKRVNIRTKIEEEEKEKLQKLQQE